MSNRAEPMFVGQSFGRLTILSFHRNEKGKLYALCACSCVAGRTKPVRLDHLRTGKTVSCGCFHDEAASSNNIKHGHSKRRTARVTAEYRAWLNMNDRCHREENNSYANYGARGIVVCAEWRESFEAFLAHIGSRPSAEHSVDRFPDNDGNYEPGNVRWATRAEQASNKRNSVILTVDGESATITEWARRGDLSIGTISRRLADGWSTRRAIFEPVTFKLNDEKVAQAIARVRAGESRSSVARSFGVTFAAISCVVRGRTWKRLTAGCGIPLGKGGKGGVHRKVA